MVIVSLSDEAGLGEVLVSTLVYKLYKLIAPNKKGIQFVYVSPLSTHHYEIRKHLVGSTSG